jgi:hypothetical protein
MSLVNLGFSVGKSQDRMVSAEEGRRVILKDPQAFFEDVVLVNDQAWDKLILWLSATANRQSIFNKYRTIKIWMLTGYYTLKDAKITIGRSGDFGVSANVDSSVSAVGGGPAIGGSIDLNLNKGTTISVEGKGWLVWAAQWCMLDVSKQPLSVLLPQFVRKSTILKLWMDVVSHGIMYHSEPEPEFAQVSVQKQENFPNISAQGLSDSIMNYLKREDPTNVIAMDEVEIESNTNTQNSRIVAEMENTLQWAEDRRDRMDRKLEMLLE